MNEAQWLTTTDSVLLLRHAAALPSPRKRRLLVCSACRAAWALLIHPGSRKAVEVAEQFADGRASEDDLASAAWYAEAACYKADEKVESYRSERRLALRHGIEPEEIDSIECDLAKAVRIQRVTTMADWAVEGDSSFFRSAGQDDIEADTIRDIYGNPFRASLFNSTWRTSAVLGLASQMYDTRDFSVMPILGDALEDAGCEDADILAHCRGEGPHVRGCWVVDLLLGKE